MVAAAFKAIVKIVGDSGRTFAYSCTVSDVNAQYYVHQDSADDVVLSSVDGTLHIVDVLLTGSGTDTSQAEIYVNGRSTGEKIMNAANVATAVQRQFTGFPVNIAPGSRLRIKQLT